MKSDVVLNKIYTIERCIHRIQEVYNNNSFNLKDDTKQDSIILNFQRACEAAIDIAMYIIITKKLGLPHRSQDAFDMLEAHAIIETNISKRLKAMLEFRDIAVHDFLSLDLDMLQEIIERHLHDFTDFTKIILKAQ